jgi:hypothetical protein
LRLSATRRPVLQLALSVRNEAGRQDHHQRDRRLSRRFGDDLSGGPQPAEGWEEMGYGHFPVCVAKTEYSFSINPSARGAPDDDLTIREVRLSLRRRSGRDQDHAGPTQGPWAGRLVRRRKRPGRGSFLGSGTIN